VISARLRRPNPSAEAVVIAWAGGLLHAAQATRALGVLGQPRAADGDPDAVGAAFAAAIAGLRQHSTPYHLAHGLLDHAAYLAARGDTEAAAAAAGEAAGIAARLGCQPLADRADTTPSARPRTTAS